MTLDEQIDALGHAIKVLTDELARLVQLRLDQTAAPRTKPLSRGTS